MYHCMYVRMYRMHYAHSHIKQKHGAEISDAEISHKNHCAIFLSNFCIPKSTEE